MKDNARRSRYNEMQTLLAPVVGEAPLVHAMVQPYMQHTSASPLPTSPLAATLVFTSPAPPIAWQPIKDADGALIGHEIFNRSRTASAHTLESDLALTHAVLSHIEPAKLLGDGLLFLNTTFESLGGSHLDLLPAHQVVLEIPSLGHAASSEALARRPALQALRAKGFALAFNHSVLDSAYAPWHDLVNYLKIDFSVLSAERAVLMLQWARRISGATLIADKIESRAQLQLAQENKAHLLQGYAVSRPEPVPARVVLPSTTDVAALSTALSNQAETAALVELLQQRPALMFNLLRMSHSQDLEARAPYLSLSALVQAYPADHLRAWETMLQAVAAKIPQLPEVQHCEKIYPRQSAELASKAQAMWPDVAADSLQLIASALLLGHVLGLTVEQTADQLLPSALAQPVRLLTQEWQRLLQALA